MGRQSSHTPACSIAELLGCDPATVRRWIHRYNAHGTAGLCDRPRPGRPRRGSPRLGERIRRLLAEPKAWTVPRLYQRLGRPAMSLRTLGRRVGEVARWRRPRLVAKGDPDRDQVLATLRQAIAELPTGAAVLAEDETHVNLLPLSARHLDRHRDPPAVMTPGTNRRRTIFGAVDVRTGDGSTRSPARPSAPPSRPSASTSWPPTRAPSSSRWSATT